MPDQVGTHHVQYNGYPELASVMGPHRGMALFKRFAALNARSLLHRQAELLDMEEQLHVQTELDRKLGLPFHTDARALLRSRDDPVNGRQWHMILEIREKLKEYSKLRSDMRGACKL